MFRGPALRMVCELIAGFAPDVVVSDSEPWTHRAARRLRIPRISFDRYAALVHCDLPMGRRERLWSRFELLAYRWLMAGTADRYVIASFYEAPPRRPGVCLVGPVLRDIVRDTRPVRGDYLLAYFSNGHIHFTPRVEQVLRASRVSSVVYGTGREGVDGTLDFRPPSNTRFVEDLARCRAVFSTAGNQLISEAIHLRKPLLLMPEDALEQRLNAEAVERLGVGLRTSRTRVTPEAIHQFLADEPRYAEHFPDRPADGRARAVAAIERAAGELAAERQGGNV